MAWTVASNSSPDWPNQIPHALLLSELATDSSAKTLVYDTDVKPLVASKPMLILAVYFEIVTTATAGNRAFAVDLTDTAGTILYRAPASAVTAASLTRKYAFGQGLTVGAITLNALVSNQEQLPAGLMLFSGLKLKVWDTAAIAAGADDMTLHVLLRAP